MVRSQECRILQEEADAQEIEGGTSAKRRRSGEPRWRRAGNDRGWTVFEMPTRWTVFEIPSTPWVSTSRRMGDVRARSAAYFSPRAMTSSSAPWRRARAGPRGVPRQPEDPAGGGRGRGNGSLAAAFVKNGSSSSDHRPTCFRVVLNGVNGDRTAPSPAGGPFELRGCAAVPSAGRPERCRSSMTPHGHGHGRSPANMSYVSTLSDPGQ